MNRKQNTEKFSKDAILISFLIVALILAFGLTLN